MTIGSEIKQLRGDYNLTQAQLATVVGVSGQSVYYWERDEFQPAPHILECLAQMWSAKADANQRPIVEKWIDERLAAHGERRAPKVTDGGGSALLAAAATVGLGMLLLAALSGDDKPRRNTKRKRSR